MDCWNRRYQVAKKGRVSVNSVLKKKIQYGEVQCRDFGLR